MVHRSLALLGLLVLTLLPGTQEVQEERNLSNRIIVTEAGEAVLVEEVLIDAPVAEVWKAFTTTEGYGAWMAPVVAVDLRIGGSLKHHFNPNASIGDSGTYVREIVNYVPERLLTLRPEPRDDWVEAIRRDADHLMAVLLFDRLAEKKTRLTVYTVGFSDAEGYGESIRFLAQTNAPLFRTMKWKLEGDRDE